MLPLSASRGRRCKTREEWELGASVGVLSQLVNKNVAPEYALAERSFRGIAVCPPGPLGEDLRRDRGQSGEVDRDDAREIILL
jgi:hypothetical protein